MIFFHSKWSMRSYKIMLEVSTLWVKQPGPWFNIKISSYQYRKSHCGDKMVVRSAYFHNEFSYTGKMTYLYWFSPLGHTQPCLLWLCGMTANWTCWANLFMKLRDERPWLVPIDIPVYSRLRNNSSSWLCWVADIQWEIRLECINIAMWFS